MKATARKLLKPDSVARVVARPFLRWLMNRSRRLAFFYASIRNGACREDQVR